MNRTPEINNISAALVKAQQEMSKAVKAGNNPFFKSKYADLNAVREACFPALNSNGITVLQPIIQIEGKSYVETVLLHESGQLLTSLTEIITAKDKDPQAYGSGISYARRYGLQSFVGLGSEDDDAEKAMNRNKKATNKEEALEEKPKRQRFRQGNDENEHSI